jgi:type VI protein secretion system component Hcp
MRRGIWIGAALLVAVVAAIPLWLVLDDGGVRRLGSIDSTTVGQAGRMTIPGVNGDVALPIDSFVFRLVRPVGATQPEVDSINVTLSVGTSMPQLVGRTVLGTKAATAKLELVRSINTQPTAYLTFDLTNVSIDGLQDDYSAQSAAGESGTEAITLRYDAMSMSCIPVACAQPDHTQGNASELGIPELGSNAVMMDAVSVPVPKGGKGAEAFAPAKVTTSLNYLLPGLFRAAQQGAAFKETVEVDLVKPAVDSVRKIATYKFGSATVTSLAISATPSDAAVVVLELSYRRLGATAYAYNNNGTLDKAPSFCFSLDTKSSSCTGL